MPGNEEPQEAQDELQRLKQNQEMLTQQISMLEQAFAYPNYKEQSQRELLDLMKCNMRQNQKLAERIEYVLKMLSKSKEDPTRKNIQKILVALGRAQINMLDQIAKMQSQIANLEATRISYLEKSNKALSDKIDKLSKEIESLPYEQQINLLGKELATVLDEIKTFEDLVTTEAPEQLMLSINALRNDLETIRNRTGVLQTSISKVRKGEEEIEKAIPHLAKLGSMEVMIQSVENKINELEKLAEQGKQSAADKRRVQEILKSLKQTNKELEKLEQWFTLYPIGDAQEMLVIKQHFEDLKQQITDLQVAKEEHEIIKERRQEIQKENQ